jgi:hypothetical protein
VTIWEKFQAVLVADVGLIAIEAAAAIAQSRPARNSGDWIKVGFVGQAVALQYISHFSLPSQENRTHDGRARLEYWPNYQVSAFASSFSGSIALAQAIMTTLQNYRSGGLIITRAEYGPNIHEDPEQIFQQVLEFSAATSF